MNSPVFLVSIQIESSQNKLRGRNYVIHLHPDSVAFRRKGGVLGELSTWTIWKFVEMEVTGAQWPHFSFFRCSFCSEWSNRQLFLGGRWTLIFAYISAHVPFPEVIYNRGNEKSEEPLFCVTVVYHSLVHSHPSSQWQIMANNVWRTQFVINVKCSHVIEGINYELKVHF